MSRKAPAVESPEVIADFWAVVCLKRGENGLWAPLEQPFPTKGEAETHAEALREGNQGAVKVMPRMWA